MINHKGLEQYLAWARHFQESQIIPACGSRPCGCSLAVGAAGCSAAVLLGSNQGNQKEWPYETCARRVVSGSVPCFCKRDVRGFSLVISPGPPHILYWGVEGVKGSFLLKELS